MKEFTSNLKFVWQYARDYKGRLIKYILCNIVIIIISIIVPILSANLIVTLTNNQFEQLLYITIIVYIIENLRNIVSFIATRQSLILHRETFTKIQTVLGQEILKLENKTIDENSSGLFIQRLTNDTTRITEIFNVLNYNLTNIIIYIGMFIAILTISIETFIYLLVMIFILYYIENKRASKRIKLDKKLREENEKVSGFVGEIVRGIRDIKMLNAEKSFMNELHDKVIRLNSKRYDMQNINRKYNLLIGSSRDLIDLLLTILITCLILNKKIEVATALILYNYSGNLPNIVYFIGMFIDQVKDFNLSSSRIQDIINSNKFPKEKFGTKHLDKVEGNFEFKNVEFSYDKDKILKNLNFKINANETVAFVGKSGAGKTTIFSLLCQMYHIQGGEILIDGYNINELDKDTIRGNITIISQSPYIFNMSIRDNLKLVKEDITEEEMINACKIACLDEFINELPDKYDTIIGEGGVNLSGGQKQRLAIARALIQKTEIILFDEATSALDNETQEKIQQAIDNMKNEYTILIIAHRLSTIINADRILFLEDGVVKAEGTHQELLNNCIEYKHLYESEITE